MNSAMAAPLGAFDVSEVHIRLIVHDPSAISALRLAACELRRQALHATDPVASYACVAACNRVLAVATAYEHFKSLRLQHETEMVQDMPELCRDLCACFDDGLSWAQVAVEKEFSTLSALREQGAVGALVGDAVEQSSIDTGCAVCFSLERDAAGEWVMAEDTELPADEYEGDAYPQWLGTVMRVLRGWMRRPRPDYAPASAPIRIAPAALSN